VARKTKHRSAGRKAGSEHAEEAKRWEEAASMRFDRVERGCLLGLELVLAALLIVTALADGGLLARMILAAGAIQGVVLARGRQVLRPRGRSRVM
jgi:NAD dependent epimerase/dehydratase family enzyme